MSIKKDFINALMLFLMVLINFFIGFSQIEYIYNSLNYLVNSIGIIYILLNLNFKNEMLVFITLQFILVIISIIINIQDIYISNINSVISTFIGFTMLVLIPNKMNKDYLNKYISYLIHIILFSNLALLAYHYSEEVNLLSFQGFDGNPNAASMTFLCCIMLSTIFIKKNLINITITLFFFLILATGSRAGLITSLIFLLLIKKDNIEFRKIKLHLVLLILTIGILFLIYTNIFNKLINNFSTNGLSLGEMGKNDRLQFWYLAVENFLSSPKSFLFGTGPATIVGIINAGVHNSYLYQLTCFGILYSINSLLLILYKIKSINNLVKVPRFSYYAIPILIYGIVEDGVFDGLYKLWFIFIFLAIFFQACLYPPNKT
jgi:hypothetical protein